MWANFSLVCTPGSMDVHCEIRPTSEISWKFWMSHSPGTLSQTSEFVVMLSRDFREKTLIVLSSLI